SRPAVGRVGGPDRRDLPLAGGPDRRGLPLAGGPAPVLIRGADRLGGGPVAVELALDVGPGELVGRPGLVDGLVGVAELVGPLEEAERDDQPEDAAADRLHDAPGATTV